MTIKHSRHLWNRIAKRSPLNATGTPSVLCVLKHSGWFFFFFYHHLSRNWIGYLQGNKGGLTWSWDKHWFIAANCNYEFQPRRMGTTILFEPTRSQTAGARLPVWADFLITNFTVNIKVSKTKSHVYLFIFHPVMGLLMIKSSLKCI